MYTLWSRKRHLFVVFTVVSTNVDYRPYYLAAVYLVHLQQSNIIIALPISTTALSIRVSLLTPHWLGKN